MYIFIFILSKMNFLKKSLKFSEKDEKGYKAAIMKRVGRVPSVYEVVPTVIWILESRGLSDD